MNVLRAPAIRVLMVAMLAVSSLSLIGLSRRAPATNPSTNPGVVVAPAIPEPAAFVVFAIGAGVVGLALHRRSRKT